MKPNEYLKRVLEQQTFSDDDQEMKDLQRHRRDIEATLRASFSGASPSICWAGSKAKRTMIRESYDGDMTCYFPHDDIAAGSTLAEIYDNTRSALAEHYHVEIKPSAIRVLSKDDWHTDLHVDVVPGRFINGNEGDVNLHRTTGDKQSFKTNLQTHIDHIKDSGVTDAIRLMKLWKVRNHLDTAKTFVIELLVVKILKSKKSSGLAEQLEHVWTQFRDDAPALTVEDPANPTGNDLKPILDTCRHLLSDVAKDTLWQVENNGWEAVFGELEESKDGTSKAEALKAAAVHVATPTRPWAQAS